MQNQSADEIQESNNSEHNINNDNASEASISFPTHITKRYSPESFSFKSTFSLRSSDPYLKRPSTSITRASNKSRMPNANARLTSSMTFTTKSPTSTKAQSTTQNKQQLFQPQPPPRQISGPVFYYKKINRIEQKERAAHLQEIKRKAFNSNINSPFKQDMLQLRENSVKSSKRSLAQEHQEWVKQRNRENKESRKAIIEDFEKERRHCKKDYLSSTHPIVHILDLDS